MRESCFTTFETKIDTSLIPKELNNYSIVFNLIVEELNEDKMLYTGREKFEKMAESNPALKMLQNKLKLMID